MAEVDGNSSLSMGADQLSGAENAPGSVRSGSGVGCIGGSSSEHLVESSFVYEHLGQHHVR